MEFLNVDYLKNLEKETTESINYMLGSIGGGSTVFYIGICLFVIYVLISVLGVVNFTNFLTNIKRNIHKEKSNLNELKKYKNNFEIENSFRLYKSTINQDREYKLLLDKYKISKVGILKKGMFYILAPLYYVVGFDKDTNGVFCIIGGILAILFVICGTFMGIVNSIKEEINYGNKAEDVFVVEGTSIKYPILYYKKESNSYQFYYLSGNDIKKVNYEGVVHIDSNLVVDNTVLEDKIFVVDSNLDIDSSVLTHKEIIGYLEMDSYTSYINEYNEFKKGNKEFLKDNVFYDYLEDLEYTLSKDFEINNIILKSN